MTPQQLLTRVLYRDGLIIILDKPAGIAVHPGPGGGPNLEAFFDALRFGFPRPPALAHRLDRDTSGCLVLGRHPKALRRLGRLFSNGAVYKTYWAVVKGQPPAMEGRLDHPLLKVDNSKGWRVVVDAAGRPAVTDYKVRGQAEGLSWLELNPRTGRTHQIRVHCATMGCPIVGDPVYGDTSGPSVPLHLHARAISLPLYPRRDPIHVQAHPPPHMVEILQKCGYKREPLKKE